MTFEIEYEDIEVKTIDNRVFRYEKGYIMKWENELLVQFSVEDETKRYEKEIRFNLNHIIAYSYTYAHSKKRCDTSPIKP